MATATMSLLALQKWLEAEQDDLFAGLTVPEGIDKDTLVDNILIQSADFEVLYPSPGFMKEAITKWSNKMRHTFKKWVDALNVEYDPLNNYDRTEIHSGTDSSANNTQSSGTTSDSNLTKVSAFDSDTLRDDTENSGSASSSARGTASGSTTYGHQIRTFGNIGVTTSQQMLQSELDIARWNIYEHITDLFMNEFCIMVY